MTFRVATSGDLRVEAGKPVDFRLYIPETHDYYRVMIFGSIVEMREFRAEYVRECGLHFRGGDKSFAALVSPHIRYNRAGKVIKECGQILFCTEYTRSGIVSHEMTHAAIAWMRRKRRDPGLPRNEERLCAIVGRLTAKFWFKYWELCQS